MIDDLPTVAELLDRIVDEAGDVLERLGEGARSTIYAVRDPETRQVYALKHVVRAEPKDIRFIEQMETEFEISRQFTHPNLRRSFDLKIIKSLLLLGLCSYSAALFISYETGRK